MSLFHIYEDVDGVSSSLTCTYFPLSFEYMATKGILWKNKEEESEEELRQREDTLLNVFLSSRSFFSSSTNNNYSINHSDDG